MGSTNFLVLYFLAYVASLGMANNVLINNVIDGGAVGDGIQDDSQAFLASWTKSCNDPYSPTILVPSGKTFLLGKLDFVGPCKAPIHIQIEGNIVAPKEIWSKSAKHWLTFESLKGIKLSGNGQIDGSGSAWWACREANKCARSDVPNALVFESCTDISLDGLKIINSPKIHVYIYKAVGVHISSITITAPGESPNTDGIHIEKSQHVEVVESTIGTGDDCVSIGTDTSYVNISEVTCGPGHGISIGSLGRDGSKATVEQIHVSSSDFIETTNGVRIKTWQGGSGYAKGITFERISFTSVKNPIVIDQYYCDDGHNCGNATSAVKVSDVRYIDMIGSSANRIAVSLNCSQTVGCTGIVMDNVTLTSSKGYEAIAFCSNAQGTSSDPIKPPVPCLQ